VKVLGLAFVAAVTVSTVAAGSPWIVLFDGKSTDAWRGYREQAFPASGWAVENGTLHAVAGGHGDVVTKETFKDFELELEWKVAPGANSGIFYRGTEAGDAIYMTAPEMQILDDAKHPDGKSPLTSAGSLYALVAPEGKTLAPVGEWNTVRIVVKGSHVEHWLNGKKVVDVDLASPETRTLIAGSKFAAWTGFAKAPEGVIGLQNHGDDVWFRNIRVRRLS
jgi:hypothetical protein